jgi:capsular exopolysaccharide synthesis family protein
VEKGKSIIDIDDLRFILKIASKNWYWFVLLPLIAAGMAYVYTYQLPRIYAAKTEILLKSDDTYDYQSKMLGGGVGGGSVYALFGDITNQKRVINSHDLIGDVISKLDFNISYFIEGRFKTDEIYQNTPFKIEIRSIDNSLYEQTFRLNIISVDSFEIQFPEETERLPIRGMFNEMLIDNDLIILVSKEARIRPSNVNSLSETNYLFVPHSDAYLIRKYKRIKISNVKYTSILTLQVSDEIPKRAIHFLDTLSKVYIQYTLKSRIEKNENTRKFINKQMDDISIVIKDIERELGGQNIFGKESDGMRSSLIEQLSLLDVTEIHLNKKIKQIALLDSFLVSGTDDVLPLMYGVDDDPFIQSSLTQLYDFEVQKYSDGFEKTNNSMSSEKIEYEKKRIKKELLLYIDITNKKINSEIKQIQYAKQEKEGVLKQMPKDEREILNIERKLQINQSLYNFLIEQRAKLIIARAGIIPESKVIEKGRSLGKVSPDENKIMLTFVTVGVLIAALIAAIRVLFFDKIESIGELKSMSVSPVLGGVPYTDLQNLSDLVESSYLRSPVAESFRSIRANIQYLSPGKDAKVIMVTSLYPGEGKTFSSVNIASIFARANKKVLLLDFDMHKPRVHKYFDYNNQHGLSTYLSEMTNYTESIVKSPILNLDVLTAGPVPPNASELVLSPLVEVLLAEQKKIYDFIVIDTPPVMLISDTMILTNHTDVNIYVMNTKKANRRGAKILNEINEKHPDKNHAVILNNIRVKKFGYYYGKYQYAYGGYGYGYGYGYGQENAKK